LERGDFAALPGITYCAGFTRAYARAVGLDEKALVAKVREEIDEAGDFAAADAYRMDEPADPARVPPRSLAWVAAILGVLMVSGYGIWRMQINTPPGEEAAAVAPTAAKPGALPARPVAPPVLTGPVVLTAVDDVWLRIYDADGVSILQKTLAKGESFTVPATAKNPMILTGRPDALSVTVGGRAIPPLGTAEHTISDVPISAEALLARGTTGQQPETPPVTTAPTTGQQAPTTRTPAVQPARPTEGPPRPASNAGSQRSTTAPKPAARTAPVTPAPAASPSPSPAGNASGQ
jgi:hypothetical protein